MKISILPVFIFVFSFFCSAQTNGKANDLTKDIRLNQKKPSVFITFERYGERFPTREDENAEGIWLRIHNNSRWKIYLKSYGADNEDDEYQVSYEIQKIPGLEWKTKGIDPPIGYRITNAARVRAIESGKSILFNVPKENLADGLSVLVNFSYEWELLGESAGDNSIKHQAPFWSTDLLASK